MTAATGSGAVLGGHLAHVLLFGGWGLAVAVVLVWPHDKSTRYAPGGTEPLVPSADRTWLQLATLGLGCAAATHLAVMPAHFRESWLYGTFFVVAACAQLAAAALVLVRPSPRVLLACAAGSLAVVGLWVVSRFVGVPIGPDNGATEAIGVLDVMTTLFELLTATACAVVLAGRVVRPAWRWSLWSLPLRLLMLALAVGVPVTSALSSRG